ncbi:hypothetical protein ACHHYP_11169 [Achlya hypogyna]|uniref:Uncharacterized protein n=1 Tax=Achlya hypogyna TaxID=1202772 RepID=A0A1V9YJP4_ACHHY|nr:hypothetical protein ACHHYP_11169 [Achlya hypogyna]
MDLTLEYIEMHRQLQPMLVAMESPLALPHVMPDPNTTETMPYLVTVLPWYQPVSLEPIAFGSALLSHVPEWMALGETLEEDEPIWALALFRGCYYTNAHHLGRQATATLEAQVAVGDCLAQLHRYADAHTWLADAWRRCDPSDVKFRDCMAPLGLVHLKRQEVEVARTLLERVALLDELDAGPADCTTLESLLNVATVYRYSGNYAAAITIATSVVTTAQSNVFGGDDATWRGVIYSGSMVLGLLLCSTGDFDQGCEYLYDGFRWQWKHYGVGVTSTWSAFSAWYWCSEQTGRFALPTEASRLVAAVTIMPPTIGDWSGKVCVTCTSAIAGPAFAPAAACLYTVANVPACTLP